ncbi:MAG: helix-turn-helix transcriptional regulator, partial [Rhizobiales bacterium]|nr:helix-turn-helix transcriptional regulator [Hyphomicrobiales bacterium]
MDIDHAARQLEALGNPTRLRIYRSLVRAGGDGLPVGRLQERLAIPGSTLSHHLRQLVAAGLITQERVATTLI